MWADHAMEQAPPGIAGKAVMVTKVMLRSGYVVVVPDVHMQYSRTWIIQAFYGKLNIPDNGPSR